MASRSWNKVELMGNLTRDPELRFTPNGAAVCTFGLATNRSYVVDGEKREEVDFHKIVAWNKLGELCNQLLKKGTGVFVSGRLHYREWEPAEGQKRREAEISIDDMIIITPKAGNTEAASGGSVESLSEKVAAKVKENAAKVTEDTSVSNPVEEPVTESTSEPAAVEEKVSADEDLPF